MIDVSGLWKTFRSGRGTVAALKDVSFFLGKGEVLVIAGKSGSGKTTLMNCIGGLEKPEKGRIVCDGTDIHSLKGSALSRFQRSRLGFVFQSGNLLSYLTVCENIEFPLSLNEIPSARRKIRVEELLDAVGLKGMGPAMPFELSAGETQRVAFARAMAHGPAILLADEPTANLDHAHGGPLLDLMTGLARETGTAFLIASHDPAVIGRADEVFRLEDGRRVNP